MPTTNQLILGDCIENMAALPPASVDMVLTDLPYEATQHNWDSIIPPEQLWQSFARICKPKANIILTATNPFAAILIGSNPKWFRYDWIWIKNKTTGFLNVSKMPLRQHELVLIFGEGQGTWNPQKTNGHQKVNSFTKRNKSDKGTYGALLNGNSGGGQTDRFPTSVIYFPVINNDDPKRIHPNQKPIPFLEYFIRSYSNPGETILDCTMGSGATGVACIHTNRNFIGIEKNAEYFQKASDWIQEEEKQFKSQPLLIEPDLAFSKAEIEQIGQQPELL